MTKREEQPYSKLPFSSTGKLITGLVLGLIFAFIFYNFLYLLKEAIRILFFSTEEEPLLVLSAQSTWLHNFFFALVSVIFGQSLCILYCFNLPFNKNARIRLRQKAIINEQVFLNFTFFNWFTRLAVAIALTLGGLGAFTAYRPEAFSQYDRLFFLFIPVLFLYSWTTLRKLLNKSMKWMSVSLCTLTFIAWIFTFFHPINTRNINEILLNKNAWYLAQIELPEVEYFSYLNTYNKTKGTILLSPSSIFMKSIIDRENTGYQPISPDTLGVTIQDWNEKSDYHIFNTFILYIDRNTPMERVHQLKLALSDADISRVEYGVVPYNGEYENGYYRRSGISCSLPAIHSTIDPAETRTILKISHSSPDEIVVNTESMSAAEAKRKFKSFITEHPNLIISYTVDGQLPFANYIDIISSLQSAVDYARKAYATKYHKEKFRNEAYLQYPWEDMAWELPDETRRDIENRIYPFSMVETVTTLP